MVVGDRDMVGFVCEKKMLGREGGGEEEDIDRIWQSMEVVGLRDFGLSLTTVDWHSTSTIGSPVCV